MIPDIDFNLSNLLALKKAKNLNTKTDMNILSTKQLHFKKYLHHFN